LRLPRKGVDAAELEAVFGERALRAEEGRERGEPDAARGPGQESPAIQHFRNGRSHDYSRVMNSSRFRIVRAVTPGAAGEAPSAAPSASGPRRSWAALGLLA